MLIISEDDVRREMTIEAAIPLMRQVMRALSLGEARQELRRIVPLDGGALGLMPGALAVGQPFGVKLMSVFPGAHAFGLPSHQGLIVLFHPQSGEPLAMVEAASVTELRTAAVSAVATDVLANPEARRLAILGAGRQGRAHALAIAKVRDLESVSVWSRNLDHAVRLASELKPLIGVEGVVAHTPAEAAADADIICTTSSASEPILMADEIKPGAHINAVGSSRAGPCEIDPHLAARAVFVADHRASVLEQGEEWLRATRLGLIGPEHLRGELGEVIAGRVAGRGTPDQITLYKSLGSIVQDLAVAAALADRASVAGFGVRAPLQG
jgi:ornithine cyclodeaminase/alanine dehydrogenase-like protein (mu-crystallin family)